MNIYHIQYHYNGDNFIHSEEILAQSVKEVDDLIQKNGATLLGRPEFIREEKSMLFSIKKHINNILEYFSRPTESEILRFLEVYANSQKGGQTKIKALQKAKGKFGLTAKRIRGLCDELIVECEKGEVEDFAELLLRFDSYFPEKLIQLLVAARGASVDPMNLISNEVSQDKVGLEMEGYVQLATRKMKFKRELVSALRPPILWFLGICVAVVGVTVSIVPMAISALSRIKTFSPSDFPLPSRQLFALSDFFSNYGTTVLVLLSIGTILLTFAYATNRELRYQIEAKLLRTWVLQDILRVYFTLEVASNWAIFLKAGKTHRQCLELLSEMTPLIPMKDELKYVANTYSSTFADVLSSYSEDDRFFTESFYTNIGLYLDDGFRDRCFSEIIKDTLETWYYDVQFYPKKLGALIKGVGLLVGAYLVFGLGGFIISMSTKGVVS